MHQEIKNKGEIVIYQTPDGVAELDVRLVCAKFAYTTPHGAMEGKTQTSIVQLYNLDVIISVGYRVKSQRGTQFRKYDLPDFRRQRFVSEYRRKGSDVALSGYEKSFVQRWQQADCGISFPVVFRKERYFIQAQRIAADRK
ncbi:hypothetical protein AGMMS50239_37070 [Bacteroidia bacterium]|nr:hypothetical protein AGMMS50239_37070 [Bacteroidia bacterium]